MEANDKSELLIELTRVGRNGMYRVQALAGDTPLHTDEIRPAKPEDRERFVNALRDRCPGVDAAAAHEQLQRIAAEQPACLYLETDTGLVRLKPTRDGHVSVQLTNFTARIVADVAEDDGQQVRRTFDIESHLNGRDSRFVVSAAQFDAMNWPTRHLGAGAIVHAGFGVKDHARVAIQTLSSEIVARTVYVHTGWREIDGTWAYLHANGAIGAGGSIAGVEVNLPDPLARFDLPAPPDGDDLVEAVRGSLNLVDVAPDEVTMPLLCAVYRAPLGPADFSVHLVGRTQVGKSELAALAQQHFGAGMDRLHLPASWSSTANALEGLAFSAKDTVLVCDDFIPVGTQSVVQRLHGKADRVLRAQGNSSGRLRMRADSTLHAAKPSRGLILSTGEDIPKGQSLRARVFLVEVGPTDVDWKVITQCQKAAADGLVARAMAAFLRWLAPRYDACRTEHVAKAAEIRDSAMRSDQHKRTPSILAELVLGIERFTEFAEEVGAISSEQAEALRERAWTALGHAAEAQAVHQAADDPVRRFLELLASAIASGNAHIAGPEGAAPETPGVWGWRKRVMGTDPGSLEGWEPQGDRLGWLDCDELYLDRDSSFRAANRMAGSGGEPITICERTLWKRLHEAGILASVDEQRGRLTIRKTLAGSRRTVLHLHACSVMGSKPPQLAQSAHEGGEEAPNGSLWDGQWDGRTADGAQPAHHNGPLQAAEPTSGTDGAVGPVTEDHSLPSAPPAVPAADLDNPHQAIPEGWTQAEWADRLRQLADTCEPLHPARAAALQAEADALNGAARNDHMTQRLEDRDA